MSSSNPPAISSKSSLPSKSVGSASQVSPAHSQSTAYFAGDVGQRRSGAYSASTAASAPRNNQSSKAKHKQSRKFRLADEDALAESVAMNSTTSRKGHTNITHLMNFALPPRPQYRPERNAARQPRRTWGMGSGYHAVDKARYADTTQPILQYTD